MQRFESVLVLTNAEKPLPEKLDIARGMAERNNARLTLFDVVEDGSMRWWSTSPAPELIEELTEQRTLFLREVADGMGVEDVEVRVVAGPSTYIEVVREVDRSGHDLVVTAPDEPGRSRLAGAPTTMHLLRKCPVPVWVHAAGSARRSGVVVAVGPPVDELEELNLTLLQLGSSMARRQEARLHVVHAWRLPGESLLRSQRFGRPTEEVDEMARNAEQQARAELAALLERGSALPPDATVHLTKGKPGEVIPRVLRHVAARTLVIGTLSRTGIQGMVIGNTAERVFGVIDCSVLAIKPPGFVSPVLG